MRHGLPRRVENGVNRHHTVDKGCHVNPRQGLNRLRHQPQHEGPHRPGVATDTRHGVRPGKGQRRHGLADLFIATPNQVRLSLQYPENTAQGRSREVVVALLRAQYGAHCDARDVGAHAVGARQARCHQGTVGRRGLRGGVFRFFENKTHARSVAPPPCRNHSIRTVPARRHWARITNAGTPACHSSSLFF